MNLRSAAMWYAKEFLGCQVPVNRTNWDGGPVSSDGSAAVCRQHSGGSRETGSRRSGYTLENFVEYMERLASLEGARHLDSPVKVEWHVTGRCNQKCSFCYSSCPADAQCAELSTEEAMDVVRQLGEANVIEVQLEGGEPFLRGDLLELVAALKENRHRIRLLTNGTGLGQSAACRLGALLRSTDVLQISLHGAAAAVHNHIVGVSGAFARVQAAMDALAAEGVAMRVSTVITRRNLGSLVSIVRWVEQYPNVQVVVMQPVIPIGQASVDAMVPSAELLEAYYRLKQSCTSSKPGLALLLGHAYDVPEFRQCVRSFGRKDNVHYCAAARSRLHIAPDGRVYPCHFLSEPEFYLGDLTESPLQNIWRSDATARVRAGRGKDAVCNTCDMGPFCTKKGLCTSHRSDGSFECRPITCRYTKETY